MNQNEMAIKKLIYAKFILLHAFSFAENTDPITPVLALNTLHDAVEMSFLAIEDLLGITDKIVKFTSHMVEIKKKKGIESFPQARNLEKLDQTRGNFKHNGVLPNKDTVKELLIIGNAFFEDICPVFFGKEFSEIGLASLVEDEEIRMYLVQAEQANSRKNYEEVFKNCAIGLEKALLKAKSDLAEKGVLRKKISGHIFARDFLEKNGHRAEQLIIDSFNQLYNVMTEVILGIDFQRLTKFRRLTPCIAITCGGVVYHDWHNDYDPNNFTPQNSVFCIHFLLDFVLKTQQKLSKHN